MPPSSAGITSESSWCRSGSARFGRAGRQHPAHRFVEAVLADGFEQVVDGADVERGDGLVVVRGHEHDGGPVREVGKHAGQLDPGQAGHVDVEEDRVDDAAR